MKRLDQLCVALIGMVLIIALTGCAPTVLPPSPEDIQTALAETLTAEPQPTEEIAETEKATNITGDLRLGLRRLSEPACRPEHLL